MAEPITSITDVNSRLLGLAEKINPNTGELEDAAYSEISPEQRLGLRAEIAAYLATPEGIALIQAAQTPTP